MGHFTTGDEFLGELCDYRLLKNNSDVLSNLANSYSQMAAVCTTFYNIKKLCIVSPVCVYALRLIPPINSEYSSKPQSHSLFSVR